MKCVCVHVTFYYTRFIYATHAYHESVRVRATTSATTFHVLCNVMLFQQYSKNVSGAFTVKKRRLYFARRERENEIATGYFPSDVNAILFC